MSKNHLSESILNFIFSDFFSIKSAINYAFWMNIELFESIWVGIPDSKKNENIKMSPVTTRFMTRDFEWDYNEMARFWKNFISIFFFHARYNISILECFLWKGHRLSDLSIHKKRIYSDAYIMAKSTLSSWFKFLVSSAELRAACLSWG